MYERKCLNCVTDFAKGAFSNSVTFIEKNVSVTKMAKICELCVNANGVTVEKVLVGSAEQVRLGTGLTWQEKAPFDAQVWFKLKKQ